MALLFAGILLYCAVHLFPAALPAVRSRAVLRLGEHPYKGVFSLLIIASIALIVFGWKAATPGILYRPPLAPGLVSSALMLIALVLFAASAIPSNIGRLIRHPQMTAVILWSAAHLLTNGDRPSLLLFGGLGAWALLEIVLCNRRDGPWQRPAPRSRAADGAAIIVGVFSYAALAWFHLRLFGVAALPT